jgi:hypothetical protein
MTSSFTWLSYNDAERQRTLEVVESLKQPGTLDELGFGTVRDTIARVLFPGASTLHTRARYLTFLPRLVALAAGSGPSGAASKRFRDLEVALIYALLKGAPEADGIIGRDALWKLKQMPSAMYWTALRTYGLITVDRGSDHLLRTAAAQKSSAVIVTNQDDVGHSQGGAVYGIAAEAAAGWLPRDWQDKGVTFAMVPDEAAYVRERIMGATEGSLYCWFLRNDVDPAGVDYPWEHPGRAEYPEEMRTLLHHAERFHHLVYGATLSYNLEVSRVAGRDDLIEGVETERGKRIGYRDLLRQWDEDMAHRGVLEGWDVEAFLRLVLSYNPGLKDSTQGFIRKWYSVAVQPSASPQREQQMRQVLSERELQTKKNRARLHNTKARDGWDGDVGIMRLGYNWSVMKRIVGDIRSEIDNVAA